MNNQKTLSKTFQISAVGVLAAVSLILYYLELSMGFIFPSFLKLDFSLLPAIVAVLLVSPRAGFLVILIKESLHVFISSSLGIGELANLIVGTTFILVFILIYRKKQTSKNLILALVLSTVSIMFAGAVANYFITLPLYAKFMNFPTEAVIAMTAKKIPFATSKFTVVLYAFAPFNLIKGIAISIPSYFLIRKINPVINDKMEESN